MRNTITIGDKNTFDDWHMFSATKLVVNPPQPKFNYVDILGMSGSLDFTEALTKVPRYSDREGSWDFTILNPGDIEQYTIEMEGSYKYDWDGLYSEILSYLHGRYFDRIILDTDPYHTYRGRIWINEAQSNSTWGRIVLNYRLQPYRYSLAPIIKRSVTFASGQIKNPVRVELAVKPHLVPTPLHFYVTAEDFDPGTLRAISINFYNQELDIHHMCRFTGAMIYDPGISAMRPKDLDREIVVPQMLVSNNSLNGDNSCLFAAGNVYLDNADYGPIKLEYWWEEASL